LGDRFDGDKVEVYPPSSAIVLRATLHTATEQMMNSEADVFWELAPLLRVRPELQNMSSERKLEPKGWAPFHIVTRGACLIDVGDRVGIQLKAGDVVVLPHGDPHTVRALPTTAGSSSVVRVHRRLYDELLVKTNVDGEPDTKLICGRMCFEHAQDNMVLTALPPVVIVPSGNGANEARLGRIVDAIRIELEDERLGAAAIAASIASSLMLIVLTLHFESAHEGKGILALLMRRQTAKAVAGMLLEPARPWTLDELASRANTSRATLVRLFQKSIQRSPLAFFADLRLGLARHQVRTSSKPLVAIAGAVGYQSEPAFTRAYRRRFGITPGEDRRVGHVMAGAGREPSPGAISEPSNPGHPDEAIIPGI
jgi:AraC family transcriptional activator of mtrCDE